MFYINMVSYKHGFDRQMPDGALTLEEAIWKAELYSKQNHDCAFVVTDEEGNIIAEFFEG